MLFAPPPLLDGPVRPTSRGSARHRRDRRSVIWTPSFVGLMDRIKDQLRLAFRTDNRVTSPISPGLARHGDGVGDAARARRHRHHRAKRRVRRTHGRNCPAPRRGGTAGFRRNGASLSIPRRSARRFWRHRRPSCSLSCTRRRRPAYGRMRPRFCALALEAGLLWSWIPDGPRRNSGVGRRMAGGRRLCRHAEMSVAPPGLAPITFSDRAVAAVKARKAPIQSWFLDLGLMLGYWMGRVPVPITHTGAGECALRLHESLTACLAKAWRPPGRATAPPMIRLVERLEGLASASSSTRSTGCRS